MVPGVNKYLKEMFDQLCKGNISIIDQNNRKELSEIAMKLYNNTSCSDPDYNENLKYLILICNVLYNRSDMTVLPVEDGLYDILLERYKRIDPHFQVGSAVVNFKSMAEKKLEEQGKKIVSPILFDKSEKSEINQFFEDQISKFYGPGMMTTREAFYNQELCPGIKSKGVHDTEHNHPQLVGTLDKCKFVLDADAIEKDVYNDSNVKILERDWFVDHIKRGIITPDQELELCLELKYDGVSVEADCRDVVVSARTRGDTGIGVAQDITPILKGYEFSNNDVLKDRTVGVKFEAIMTKMNLANFNNARGYNYANCRTAIVGLFGASDASLYRNYITLIPLALDRDNVPEVKNREEEIEVLNRLYKTKGQPLNHCYIKGNYQTCLFLIKKYAEEAMAARKYLDFMFDGIVISYLDEDIRNKLGRENYINKYQMAVKFDPDTKLTTFMGYTFEVGQNGTICPMIHYSPVEFFGTIHPKSTGSSYNRFMDLGLHVGDIIQVTYMNDVMPYVTSIDCEENRINHKNTPICEFPKVCPECGTPLEISSSGKTAVCPNINCSGRKKARMVNMLQKMNMKGFADSRISILGVYSLHELFSLQLEDLQILGPTNAENFRKMMDAYMMNPIEDYRIIGSLGFTNIGPKTWKLIFDKMTLTEFMRSMMFEKGHLYTEISNIRGIGSSTADTIFNEYPEFEEDFKMIEVCFNVVNSKDKIMLGKHIRFTGCRDKNLELQLQAMGHDADGNGSVTKNTDILLIPYEGFSSSKLSKVSDNTMVLTLSEFRENMEKYL